MRNLFILLSMVYSSSLLADTVRLISVTGLVEKSFQPDIVRINIQVWGKGDSAKKAQANNQNHYGALKNSVEKYKIKKEDIQTTSYYLNPEYVFNPKTNKNDINGYIANQTLVVTLRKIDEAGPFIDSLQNDSKAMTGGVTVNSLGFDLDKRDDEVRALLGDAVRAAEAQAEVLAKAGKVKLKGIYRLSPRGVSSPVPMYEMAAMNEDAAPRAKGGGSTQLMSGEVKISSEVSADYLIE